MNNTLTYQQIASAIASAKDLNIEQDCPSDMIQVRHQGIMMAQAQIVNTFLRDNHGDCFSFIKFWFACKEEHELIVKLTATMELRGTGEGVTPTTYFKALAKHDKENP